MFHDERARFDVGDWVLRSAVALLFTSVGWEKLDAGPQSYWIPLFAAIGFGQWLRYLTGALQLLGAILILVPRTAVIGAGLVGSTMVGAIVCHLFLLDTGIGGAIIPAVFLGFVIAAARRRLTRRAGDTPLHLL
jgi:uncharacterized membrane protein YphA (DoxX/SURF4 family)